jgi:hypothetical protein
MRTATLAALSTIAVASTMPAQAVMSDSSSRELVAVQRARVLYALLNREAPTYRQVNRTVLGMTTDGADVTGYYRGDELRRIHVQWSGETWYSDEEYYFERAKPVFMYRKARHRSRPFGPIISIEEARFYFDDGALVRWVDETGRQRPRGTGEFRDTERELLHSVRAMLKALASTEPEYEAHDDPSGR